MTCQIADESFDVIWISLTAPVRDASEFAHSLAIDTIRIIGKRSSRDWCIRGLA